MTYNEPTLDEQIEALFPLDGPYSDDDTRAAARSIAALVRYLCHATYSDRAAQYPSTIDAVIGNLSGATAGMGQLLDQIGTRMCRLALQSDAYATGDLPVEVTAATTASALREARAHLDGAQTALSRAHRYSSRIGLNQTEETP